jgi:hypothetical protein
MLQTDGSRHDWLEGRGPHLTLLGFIDDATGKVPVARFQEEAEDAVGYLRILRLQVEQVGVPLSIYHDRHSIFQRNDDHWSVAEQLQGEQSPTQVGRALQELGIASISARSPQAKGRIERLWRTFQDRLPSELRLAGAATLAQSNQVLQRFLVEYNAQFARPAKQVPSAYRKLERRLDLDYIFSLRYERKVNPDHTVTAPGLLLQLPSLPQGRGFAGKKVEICQQPNGAWRVYLDRRLLHVQPAAANAPAPRVLKIQRHRTAHKKKTPRIYSYSGHEAKGPAV